MSNSVASRKEREQTVFVSSEHLIGNVEWLRCYLAITTGPEILCYSLSAVKRIELKVCVCVCVCVCMYIPW